MQMTKKPVPLTEQFIAWNHSYYELFGKGGLCSHSNEWGRGLLLLDPTVYYVFMLSWKCSQMASPTRLPDTDGLRLFLRIIQPYSIFTVSMEVGRIHHTDAIKHNPKHNVTVLGTVSSPEDRLSFENGTGIMPWIVEVLTSFKCLTPFVITQNPI